MLKVLWLIPQMLSKVARIQPFRWLLAWSFGFEVIGCFGMSIRDVKYAFEGINMWREKCTKNPRRL